MELFAPELPPAGFERLDASSQATVLARMQRDTARENAFIASTECEDPAEALHIMHDKELHGMVQVLIAKAYGDFDLLKARVLELISRQTEENRRCSGDWLRDPHRAQLGALMCKGLVGTVYVLSESD
jgi:hypothetical protein